MFDRHQRTVKVNADCTNITKRPTRKSQEGIFRLAALACASLTGVQCSPKSWQLSTAESVLPSKSNSSLSICFGFGSGEQLPGWSHHDQICPAKTIPPWRASTSGAADSRFVITAVCKNTRLTPAVPIAVFDYLRLARQ